MSSDRLDYRLPKHLAMLVAEGVIRPGDGSRFLPKPVKVEGPGKTAGAYVSDGRR
jgi:hypothetical protein